MSNALLSNVFSQGTQNINPEVVVKRVVIFAESSEQTFSCTNQETVSECLIRNRIPHKYVCNKTACNPNDPNSKLFFSPNSFWTPCYRFKDMKKSGEEICDAIYITTIEANIFTRLEASPDEEYSQILPNDTSGTGLTYICSEGFTPSVEGGCVRTTLLLGNTPGTGLPYACLEGFVRSAEECKLKDFHKGIPIMITYDNTQCEVNTETSNSSTCYYKATVTIPYIPLIIPSIPSVTPFEIPPVECGC